jgi:Putative manganese efflux pump
VCSARSWTETGVDHSCAHGDEDEEERRQDLGEQAPPPAAPAEARRRGPVVEAAANGRANLALAAADPMRWADVSHLSAPASPGHPVARRPSAAARESITSAPVEAAQQRTRQLLITGIALSIDNLTIGFALGTCYVNLALAAITIATISVTLSLIGLELGDRIGTKTGERGELLGGLVLIAAWHRHCQRHPLTRPISLPP